jgi:uncharacterized membrane protein
LCSLVAGILFAFAVVVMPGIGNLGDREFILTFQVIDRIIQNNQPVFILVWVGSAVVLLATIALCFGQLEGSGLLLLIFATITYLFGVQLPTVIFNIPLNNKLQTLDVDTLDEAVLRSAREDFEPRWNRWNLIRTVLSSLVSGMLIILLIIL